MATSGSQTAVWGESVGITSAGQVTEFPLPQGPEAGPHSITTGPDGNLWFCESKSVDRITTNGQLSEFPTPEGCEAITAGPNGDLWFTQFEGFPPPSRSYLGRVTPEGQINYIQLPESGQEPQGITMGPEGNLWITERGGYDTVKLGLIGEAKVVRMTPQGQFTEFTLPAVKSEPAPITVGPDGNLWFAETNGRIGKVTPAGEITEFLLPRKNYFLLRITAGPDGNVWFSGSENIGLITPGGQVTQYPEEVAADSIVTGPDGNVWFTEHKEGKIGRITPGTVGVGFEGKTASVQKGKVRLTLLCGGGIPGEPCRGKVSLRLKPAKAAVSKRQHSARKRLIATDKYSASSGTPEVVALKLSDQARMMLKHRGQLTAVASATLAGSSGASKLLTLHSK